MVSFRKHNPLLRSRLLTTINTNSPAELLTTLSGLSVSELRTANYLLSEELLGQLSSEQYWNFFAVIVPSNSKGYLGTFLKAAVQLYKQGQLNFTSDILLSFETYATSIDRRKFLETLLPIVNNTDEVHLLIETLCKDQFHAAVSFLLNAATPFAYYELFCLLRVSELNEQVLLRYIIQLIKRGDATSFNMACVLTCYFDVKEVPGSFSLRLQNYELGRLEEGPAYFLKVLNR